MPKKKQKQKIEIRRSDELVAIDEELDRAVDHLNEVNEGVRDLLGTVEPETEESEQGSDVTVSETSPPSVEEPGAPAPEGDPPTSV